MANTAVLDNPGVNYCAFKISPVFPTCPVTDKPFTVAVTVQYHPTKYVIEYIWFEDWLHNAVVLDTETLESLAVLVRDYAVLLLDPDTPVCVIVEIVASLHCNAKAVAHTDNWRFNE